MAHLDIGADGGCLAASGIELEVAVVGKEEQDGEEHQEADQH